MLEFAPNGNLKGYLDKVRSSGIEKRRQQASKSLNPTDILTFAYQIANGMDYIASHNVRCRLFLYNSYKLVCNYLYALSGNIC